jgi:hypothetical protein
MHQQTARYCGSYLSVQAKYVWKRSAEATSKLAAYRKGTFAWLFGFAGATAFQGVCLVSHITLMAEAKRTAAHGR